MRPSLFGGGQAETHVDKSSSVTEGKDSGLDADLGAGTIDDEVDSARSALGEAKALSDLFGTTLAVVELGLALVRFRRHVVVVRESLLFRELESSLLHVDRNHLTSPEPLCDGTSQQSNGSGTEYEHVRGVLHLCDFVHGVHCDGHRFELEHRVELEKVSSLQALRPCDEIRTRAPSSSDMFSGRG